MARKSRKHNNIVDAPKQKPTLIQTASYARLSVEDRGQKGTSIESQQQIISNYIDEHTKFELYDTYIDSGVSGTTFERPSFKRMLRDAEDGKISCIIVKDLSRLGRNAVDAGYYAEKLFPSLGIRLISITDNYDSATDAGSIILPLTNLVNEFYAIDISKKTRSSKRQAMKDGVFVGGRPPFGYRRSPDDKRKLIVDTSAAETVKQIFTWAAEGVSIYEIAKRLNASKIPSPKSYIFKGDSSNEMRTHISGLWRSGTVKIILENEIYLGRLVQGKSRMIDFVRKQIPENEWVRCNDVHEAIVSAELFQTVQSLRNKSRSDFQGKDKTAYSVNMFKNKIYCAHCGGYLERKKNHDRYIYRCVANRLASNSCIGNYTEENTVSLAVLEQLLQYKDRLSDEIKTPSIESEVIPELRFVEMELTYIQEIIRSLYENLVDRVLNEREYRELKSGYQEKTEELEQRAGELKQKLNNDKREKAALRESLHILNGLAETMVLTKEHVDRFIERIEVFRDGWVFVGLHTFSR